MINRSLSHLELFSGVGGFRKAIELFCELNFLQSNCVGYSENDKYASITYKSNFDTKDDLELGDICEFTENRNYISGLSDFKMLTAGFPCQPFSIMGNKKGFNDSRGNVFHRICNIISIKRPRYLLLENVRNLKAHDNGNTFKRIMELLETELGYNVFYDIFNTADFGLPQNRRRIFILGIDREFSNRLSSIEFRSDLISKYFNQKSYEKINRYSDVLDGILSRRVDERYYLSEKIKPTILSNGTKGFKSRSEINQIIARPLTATMVKMHRACQDNYYSEDFINLKNYCYYPSRIRKITPHEAFKLQGFDSMFVDNAIDAAVSNHQLYKQAGNAVSINPVFAILDYIYNKKILEF